jgi:hypothetical protein
MLASEAQLMPDSADKGRPSSAPLSVEDADRLADSFTAFWEDAPAPAAADSVAGSAPSGPVAGPAPFPSAVTAPHPGAVTAPMPVAVVAPMPAVEPAPKPKPIGKQTLVGIAPINIERPTSSEPPPSSPVQSVPPPSSPVQSASPPQSTPIQSSPPKSSPVQSPPDVPGYAIAYTPKDPPSTPAVVIAPEAQSAPEHQPPENKRPFSQTVPSRVRSAPNASLAPPPPPAPQPAPAPAAVDDFNPYAPKKGKGKVIGLMLGGALLLLVSVLGVRTLGGGNRELPAASSPAAALAPAVDVVRAATVGAETPTSEPAEATPNPTLARTVANEPAPAPAPVPVRSASERVPAKSKAKTKAETASAARPVTRAPTPESSPAPTKPASKGVIVRDAPF